MRSRYRILLALVLLAMATAAGVPPSVRASIWYVSTTGANANAGTEANPWRDIQYAVSTTATVDGDTVYVENGTYAENISISTKILFIASRFALTENWNDVFATIIDGGGNGSTVSITTSATLVGFTITNGSATNGGGLYVADASPVLMNLRIENSHASSNGGGVYIAGSESSLYNIEVNGNTADVNGGGMYISNADISLSNGTISANTASDGGGVYIINANPELIDLYVEHNAASQHGGGIYAVNANSLLAGLSVYSNEALGSGGGVYLDTAMSYLSQVDISGNTALGGQGGGVYAANALIGLEYSSVYENTVMGDGGGIYAENSVLWMQEGMIYENIALTSGLWDGNGGGICLVGSTPYISNSTIGGNTAGGSGGGIYQFAFIAEPDSLPEFFDGALVGLEFTDLVANSAGLHGGGYYVRGYDGRDLPPVGTMPANALLSIDGCSLLYNSTAESGGGIYADNALLSIEGSSVDYNTAGGSGGGIYTGNSQVELVYCDIDENVAVFNGGGLAAEDSDIYSDGTDYDYNRVLGGGPDGGGFGAGVYHSGLYGSVPEMPVAALPEEFGGSRLGYTDGYISFNQAAADGGGMYLENVTLSIADCSIGYNTCSGENGGGGIYAGSSQLLVEYVDITYNISSANGGGIMLANSDIYTEDTYVAANTAAGSGGGIHHSGSYDGEAPLSEDFDGVPSGYSWSSVSDNHCDDKGGGVYLSGVMLGYFNANIGNNTAESGSGGGIYAEGSHLILDETEISYNNAFTSGGGLYVTLSEIYATSATFSYNSAGMSSGGGIYQEYDSHSEVMPASESHPLPDMFSGRVAGYFSSDIEWNQAGQSGGGIYLLHAAPVLSNTTIAENSCGSEGGGMRIHGEGGEGGYAQLQHVTVEYNRANLGGGIWSEDADILLSNVTLHENSSNSHGGGLYSKDANPSLDSVQVQNNRAGGQGGGIYMTNTPGALLSNVTVTDNSSGNMGGGMFVSNFQSTMTNLQLRGNRAASYGGGGMLIYNSRPVFDNLVVSGNYANIGSPLGCSTGGGGIHANACSTVTVKNATITGNRTEGTGGGILMAGGDLRMMNSIVWDNAGGTNDDIALCTAAVARVYYSTVDPGAITEGSNNIFCDPLFVEAVDPDFAPASSGDLRLQNHSTAIGEGTTSVEIASATVFAPLQDIAGATRPELPDMGAYENALEVPVSTIVSVDDEVVICTGNTVVVDVLINDYDMAEDTPIITSYTHGTRGTVSFEMDGLFLAYTPDSAFSGVDTFTYTIITTECSIPTTATVTIYSDPVPLAPVISGADTVVSGGAQFVYTVPSTSGVTYSWSAVNGTVVSATGASVVITWHDNYTGTVVVTAATALGCSMTDTMDVRIFHPGPVFHVCSSGSNVTGTGSESAPLATVAMGISLAQPGDTVLICPGTYYENLLIGKDIAVGSWFLTTGDTSYIAQTIIDGDGESSVVYMGTGLSTAATLSGLTLTHGANVGGGGVMIDEESSPTLNNLVITENLAIAGAGVAVAAMSAPVLSDIRIYHNIAFAVGGGMYMDESAPQLTNVRIDSNASLELGGGVYMSNASPVLTNVTVADNSTEYAGGGIYIENMSAPVLSNTTISGNTCLYAGGGIYSVFSIMQLSNCTIEGNITESGSGGGIYIEPFDEGAMPSSGQVVVSTTGTIIDNSTIRGNLAGNGSGGGVYMGAVEPRMPGAETPAASLQEFDPTIISITNTVVDSNYATWDGGGIASRGIQPYLGNVTVMDNTAEESGGGIFISIDPFQGPAQPAQGMAIGDCRIDSSVVKRNVAMHGSGGGIAVEGMFGCVECQPSQIPSGMEGVVYIDAVQIDSNRASHGSGGGLSVAEALVSVNHSSVSDNSASGQGGGIYVDYAGLALENSAVNNNGAQSSGGGLFAYEGEMLLSLSTFSLNSSGNQGGGIYMEDSYTEAEELSIENNMTVTSGGGLYAVSSFLSLGYSSIAMNSAGGNGDGGGGMYVEEGSTSFDELTVNGNYSGGSGGGVYLSHVSSIFIDNAVVNGNTAANNGGGLQVYFSDPIMSNITVAGNSAGGSGGGIYKYSEPGDKMPAGSLLTPVAPFISNAVISGNTAGASDSCAGGGGVMVENTGMTLVLAGVTLTGNSAPNGSGGGMMLSSANVEVVNTIVWNNAAPADANISRCSSAVANAYYSVVDTAAVDSSYAIVTCDPVFVSAVDPAMAPTTSGNLRLLDHSPVIGMGIDSLELAVGIVSVDGDVEGNVRGNTPDIGAYENALDIAVQTIEAVNDTLYGCIDIPIQAGVLSNDISAGGEVSFVEYTQGTSGTVSLEEEGFVYTPSNGFVGTDSFTYVISTNACARPDTAVVVVNIERYPFPVVDGTNAVCSFSTHTFTVDDTNNVATLYSWTIDAPGAATAPVIVGSSTATSVVVLFGEFNTHTLCTLSVAASTPNGCQVLTSFMIDGYSAPVAYAGGDIAVCAGTTVSLGTTGGVNPTASGGSGMYSYNWTPAGGLDDATSPAPTVTVDGTTTFAVEVTDLVTGCTAVDTITVTSYTLPALVINTTTGCGGQVTTYSVSDTNNTGANFIWNTDALSCGTVVETTNGMISVMWSSVSETTTCELSVSAVTPEQCSVGYTFDITLQPSPVIAIGGGQSVCSGSLQLYTITDSHNTGASYQWSVSGGTIVGSSSSATISVLWSTVSEGTVGDIAVTATTGGCIADTELAIQINPNPVVAITGVDSVFGGTMLEYAVSTGDVSLSYNWSADGGDIMGDATGATVTIRWSTNNTVTTTGSVVLTAVNPAGCSTTVQFPVDIYPFIPVDIAGDSTTVGDTVGVYGVAGIDTTTTSFQWAISTGGTIVGSTTGATVTVEWEDVDEPTTGTITVQVLTMDGGTGTTTFTVTIYPRPILSISGDFDVCSGAVHTYTVADSRNTGSAYEWVVSGGAVIGPVTGSTVTVQWGTTSTITASSLLVIGHEPHGFDGTSTASIAVYPNPELAIAGDTEVCGGEAATYTVADANATGITSYVWSVDGGVIQGSANGTSVEVLWDNSTATEQRSITATGAGANGCESSALLNVIVRPLPVVQIDGETAICDQSTAVYTATDMNKAGSSFTWSVDGGTIVGGQGTTTATVQWTQPGMRSITATALTTSGCVDAMVLAVEVFAQPQPDIAGMREVCADSTTVLDAGAGYASYLWSNGAQTRTIVVATGGTYSVVVANESGCSASTSATITFLPPVVAMAGDDVEICSGASVQLEGIAVSFIGAVEFRWMPETGLSNPHIADPVASPAETTTYTLLVTDGFGCSSSDQITVVVKPLPNVQVTGNTVVCTGGSTQLFATGGVSYSWSPSAGLSDPNVANPIVSPSTTTTYTVTVTNPGACTVQHSLTVTVVDPAFADAGADVEICAASSVQLQATGGVSYSWSPAEGLSNPNIANPIASPSGTTTYTVTVTGMGGCVSTDQVTVTVRPLDLDIAVMLEGPYNGTTMNTNLQQQGIIPAAQPFNTAPFNYAGAETMAGTVADVVDWVLLELRSGADAGSMVARKAALLLANGSIVEADGTPVQIGNLPVGSTPLYVVVWHRNHLPVMSNVQITPTGECGVAHSFTGALSSAYMQFMDAQKQLGAAWGMVSSDVNGDGVVNAGDRVMINNAAGQIGYRVEDVSLDGIVNAADRVAVRNNVFYVSQVP